MVQAKTLLGKCKGVTSVPYNNEVLYNVLQETHESMLVENLVVETLEPTNHIAQLYMVMNELNDEDKLRLIKEYNIHVEKYSTYTKKEQTTFIFKHSR
jgi:hypothetical protein